MRAQQLTFCALLGLSGSSSFVGTTSVEPKIEANDDQGSGSSDENETLSQNLLDEIEDSFFDALSRDPSCNDEDCWAPPESTLDTTGSSGGESVCSSGEVLNEVGDPSKDISTTPELNQKCTIPVDKHWGSDPDILRMRDKLREAGSVAGGKPKENEDSQQEKRKPPPKNRRPPVFLMPGLASTRLIAWKFKGCPEHPLLSDIKVLDIAWLNVNLIFQLGTVASSCFIDCLSLGLNQTDTDDLEMGCKLRPDEGLDAISSLSPSGIGSELLVGGTNTGKEEANEDVLRPFELISLCQSMRG